jgi:hypothetical protein
MPLRGPRIAVALWLVTLLASATTHAQECPFLPPLKTVKSLKAVVDEMGGISLSDGMGSYHFRAGGAFEVNRMMGEHCQRAGTVAYRKNSGSGSCTSVVVADDGNGHSQEVTQTRSMDLTVSMYTAGLLVVTDVSSEVGLPGFWVVSGDDWMSMGSSTPLLLQTIPGAKNTALYETVKKALQQRTGRDCPFLFEGQPAKKPRTVSEVFFVGKGNEDAARGVARQLEPVIGKVEVKEWPGSWDYDVVVVVGDTVAKSATPAGPTK